MTTLAESDVYDIDESEYVRKAELDEDVKESRLQGLKDRLAASEDAETDQLRQEIEELEARIDVSQNDRHAARDYVPVRPLHDVSDPVRGASRQTG